MEDLKQIGEALITVDKMYGILGVFGAILIVLLIASFIIYQKAYLEKSAKSMFEESLAEYKTELLTELGRTLIAQNGRITKEITKLDNKLNVLSNQETDFLSERKHAMINLFIAQNNLSRVIGESVLYHLEENNTELRTVIEKNMDELKAEMNMAAAVFYIYVKDSELNKLMAELMTDTVRLQVSRMQGLYLVTEQYKKLKHLSELRIASPTNNEYSQDRIKIMQELIETMKEKEKIILQDFNSIILKQKTASNIILNLIKKDLKE
jgi:hypothetical protein